MFTLIIKRWGTLSITFPHGNFFEQKLWIKDGLLHREKNLPANNKANGEKEFWLKGEQYRLQENGTKEFVATRSLSASLNYILHRYDNLPAIEYTNGDKEWWFEGKRHRKN